MAHASARFCSNFILPFQKCVSNHSGPPLLFWTEQNCETHSVLSTCLPPGESHINIIAGDLHIHPCSCSRQQPRDKNYAAGPWQVGNPSGARHLGRAGGPGTQMWPPVFSPRKIPSHSSSVLTQASCLSRGWLCLGLQLRPEWWSQL